MLFGELFHFIARDIAGDDQNRIGGV